MGEITKWEESKYTNNFSGDKEVIEEATKIWLNRRIGRYVGNQIENKFLNGKPLDSLFRLDRGMIVLKDENLSPYDSGELLRLWKLYEDGIFARHQFADCKGEYKSQDSYNRWFNQNAMNTYMYTVPTRTLFFGNPEAVHEELKFYHSPEELNDQYLPSNYSIYGTLAALDKINPILIASLFGTNVSLVNGTLNGVYFDYNSNGKVKRLFVDNTDMSMSYVTEKGELVKMCDSIYSFLFKKYKKPIYEVIDSLMVALVGIESSRPMKIDEEICEQTSKVLETEKYKSFGIKTYSGYFGR